MPTGYTSDLYDGKDVTLRDFILTCARAFGALIEMRDEPLSKPIPEEFQPSDYHLRQMEDAKRRLAEVRAWDDAEAERAATAEFRETLRRWQESQQQTHNRRQRYEAMLAQVEQWAPPTPDHAGLKDFMREQLESSIKFDCSPLWGQPEPMTGAEYRQREIERGEQNVDYHREHYAEDVERARQRSQWVAALRSSLPRDQKIEA